MTTTILNYVAWDSHPNAPDIRTMLRGGATDWEIEEALGRIWTQRDDHYSELRSLGLAPERAKIEMSYIGG